MNQSENRSSTNEDELEESGWTTYLEDFSLMNNYQSENYISSSSCCENYDHDDYDDNFGPKYYSLLSDAASNINAPWKNNNNYCSTNYNNQLVVNDDECSNKKLNLKKLPRNKKINHDPELEDTASSPVNSPKVSNFKHMEINYRRTENNTGNFLGNDEGSSKQFQEMKKVERGNVSLDKNGYTDLKKKGLCLVPISMFVNYHG